MRQFLYDGQKFTPFLLFPLAALIIFWPILFGGKIVNIHYATHVHYPIFSFFREIMHLSDGVPLWSSYYSSGFPAYLSQQGGFLSPIVILFFWFFDFLSANHWLTFMNFSLAGIFMYLLARNLSLSKTASSVAGLAYMFNRLNLWWGGQMIVFSNFLPIVPLVFLLLLKMNSENRRSRYFSYIIITGVALGFGWLGGFTEAVFYFSVSSFLFAVFLDFKKYNRTLNWFANLKNFKVTQGFIIAILISATLVSPWFLPTISFISLSTRSGGVDFTEGPPAGELFLWLKHYLYSSFVPFLNISPDGISSLIFIGLLVYLLAFFSFFAIRRNKFLPYFIGLFVFTFLVFFKPSGVFLLIHQLPIFSFFYGSWKWGFMSNFALALLAGFGLEYLSEAKVKINFKIFVRFLEVCGSFFLVFVLVAAVLSLNFVNYKFFISAFFIIVSILIFSLYQRGYFDFLKFQKLAVAVLLFNFVFGWQGAILAFTPREVYLSPPATISFLQKKDSEGQIFRIMSLEKPAKYQEVLKNDRREILLYELAVGYSRTPMLYGISTAGGMEAFNTRRYLNLLQKKGGLSEDFSFVSMMNVKYILSSFELPPPLRKVFETKVTKYDIPVYIYENPDVLPRVYFAKNAVYTQQTNEEKLFEELLKIDNFKEKTLIECSEPVCLTEVRPPRGEEDIVIIQELKNGYLKLKTKTNSPRWLVYSESDLPTWESRIDSQLTKIYTANYIYQAVFIPAGEHEIEFKYPGAFKQMEYVIMGLVFKN